MDERDFLAALGQYFHAEKVESRVILAGSAIVLAAGALLYWGVASEFARGMGGVLLLTGVIGSVVGGTIVLRTDRQVAQLTALYERDRAGFATIEGPRIDRVVASFGRYRLAYAAAAAIGSAFLLLSSWPLLQGLGAGLLLFAALGLVVDHFAEARAIDYAARVHAQATQPAGR